MLRDPVSAMFGALLVGGLWLVVHLMVKAAREQDTYEPIPPVTEPTRHVTPVRIGTCGMCGRENVRVHAYRPHVLLDRIDHCDGCMTTEVGA